MSENPPAGDASAPSGAKELHGRQHRAARLLALGRRPGQVAKIIGCDPSTISDWRRLKAFKALEEQIAAETSAQIVRRVAANYATSVKTLIDLLDDAADADPFVRLGAARTMHDAAIKLELARLKNGQGADSNLTADEFREMLREMRASVPSAPEAPA